VSANDKVAATFHGTGWTIGTPVTYWPGLREGDGIKSVTRSNVWDLGGRPVVMVRGAAGGIALTHIEPRELDDEDRELAREQSLRDHITDLLGDVEHFTGCHRYVEGDGTCTCLLGRLNWAVTAEELPSAMEVAIEVAAAKGNALPHAANHDYLALGTPDGAA
jgi:hypothetical protein